MQRISDGDIRSPNLSLTIILIVLFLIFTKEMKKLVLLLAVVFSVSLFSCTGTAEQAAEAVDSAATEMIDSAAAVVDSTVNAAVDSAKAEVAEVADSVKAAVTE